MKKLYHKATVHPSTPLISDHLAFLPAAILTLTAALSPQDREVLAYLISSSTNSSTNRRQTHKSTATGDHPPSFNCSCFRCYTSYWVRWDSSPNRQTIHEIIDAFEDGLVQGKRERSTRRERRKRGANRVGLTGSVHGEFGGSDPVNHKDKVGGDEEGEDGFEKGSVKKFVSFIGERIWSVWT